MDCVDPSGNPLQFTGLQQVTSVTACNGDEIPVYGNPAGSEKNKNAGLIAALVILFVVIPFVALVLLVAWVVWRRLLNEPVFPCIKKKQQQQQQGNQ